MIQRRFCMGLGLVMLVLAAAFVGYALGHPEGSFPWPLGVTYGLYGLYAACTVALLVRGCRRE